MKITVSGAPEGFRRNKYLRGGVGYEIKDLQSSVTTDARTIIFGADRVHPQETSMTEPEFTARFVAYFLANADGTHTKAGEPMADYAARAAASHFHDCVDRPLYEPENCAEAELFGAGMGRTRVGCPIMGGAPMTDTKMPNPSAPGVAYA